jgi:molybdenum cofactor biosynthesis enzyme MoaA
MEPERNETRAHLVTTSRCNYNCPYCFARKGASLFDTARFADTLELIRGLYGGWLFHLTGGEPFCHPDLDCITETIRTTGHSVAMITNLSADPVRLANWVATAGRSLRQISASFHPDMTTLPRFAERVDAVLDALGTQSALKVTMVVREETRLHLLHLAEAMNARGVTVQARLLNNAVACDAQRAKPNQEALRWPVNLVCTGELCWAGSRYVWIDVDGTVYRCVNEWLDGLAPLGPFTPEFRLPSARMPCRSRRSCCLNPRESALME